MKKFGLHIGLLIVTLISLNACDPIIYTKVEFKNESSYDLRLFLETQGFDINIDLKKEEFAHRSFSDFYDPNRHIRKIVFSRLESNEVIKEMNVNYVDYIFIYKGSKTDDDVYYTHQYILEITDDLLR